LRVGDYTNYYKIREYYLVMKSTPSLWERDGVRPQEHDLVMKRTPFPSERDGERLLTHTLNIPLTFFTQPFISDLASIIGVIFIIHLKHYNNEYL
jgi:hypothetical protein